MIRLTPLALVALLATAVFAAPATAEPMPPLSKTVTPEFTPLMSEIVRAERTAREGQKAAGLVIIDDVLTKLPATVPLRGVAEMTRAQILERLERIDEAELAVDDAIRLLPGYSMPLFLGFTIYTFGNRPAQGADLLLRAAAIDPGVVRERLDDHDLSALLGRLRSQRDERRIGLISERLVAIGWRGAAMSARAGLAQTVLTTRLRAGDVAGARALIPELSDPQAVYGLLADRDYQALWPDLETAAGPELSRLWSLYLEESRGRWAASKDPEATRFYIAALASADRDAALASTFGTLFEGDLDREKDYPLLYSVAPVTNALGQLGRFAEAEKVFAAAARIWPLGDDVNALNILANRARFLLAADKPGEALVLADRFIAVAESMRPSVNDAAIVAVHGVRACALAELKRTDEAALSRTVGSDATDVSRAVTTNLCFGDQAAAKRVALAGLADPNLRLDALRMLQRPAAPSWPSAYARKMSARWERLRSDPEVVAAVNEVGRVLPFTATEGAAGLRWRRRPDEGAA